MKKAVAIIMLIAFVGCFSSAPLYAMGAKPKECTAAETQEIGDTKTASLETKYELQTVVNNFFDAYNYEDSNVFIDLVSEEYKGANGMGKDDLITALGFDYQALDDIALTTTSITQVVEVPGMKGWYAATVRWDRTASFPGGDQEKWLDSGEAEMVFEDMSATEAGVEGYKLIRMRGEFPFGLTDLYDRLVVRTGRIGGTDIVGSLTFIGGMLGASGTSISGTATVTAGVNSFDFESGNVITPATAGDITRVGGTIMPNAPAAIRTLSPVPLSQVDFVPDGGYSSNIAAACGTGNTIAVITRSGNYGVIHITAVAGATVTFNWKYQTEPGDRSF